MQEQFEFNPSLSFVKPGYKGNRVVDGRFVNEDGSSPIGFGIIFKWMFSANPQREEKKAENFHLAVKHDRSIFTNEEDAFAWLGHSCFLFRLNGKLLITDPSLFDIPRVKRLVRSPYEVSSIKGIDYILLSHAHFDHLDTKTIRLLLQHNPEMHFLVPLRVGKMVKALGAKHVTEAGWYQQYDLPEKDGLKITYLPAKHWSRRTVNDTNRLLWGSFMLQTEKQTIYFAGDTAFSTHFEEIGKIFPGISYAFMPIGAYKPPYIMQGSHTSPSESVEGFNQLGASSFVPMHFGTFDLSDEPLGEPIRLVKAMAASGMLQGNLVAPDVGETVRFRV